MKLVEKIAALISISLSYPSSSDEVSNDLKTYNDQPPNLPWASVANPSADLLIAAHRSHSSHSSHGSHSSHSSHRSSSGSRTVPAPSPSPAPSTPSRDSSDSSSSDPLGQPPKPEGSKPREADEEAVMKRLLDPETRENIIMRVQLTLQFEGYYDGEIDGIMGDKTRAAVKKYKEAHGIDSKNFLDAKTLNEMGIVAK